MSIAADLPDVAGGELVSRFQSAAGLADFGLSHLDQYFGLWCVQPEPFQSAVDRVSGINLRAHVELQQAAGGQGRARVPYEVTAEGVAIVRLDGPLMKYVSSMSAGTSTVQARQQLRAAAADEEVRGILLLIDSPGGTVAGTKDLADEVTRAAASKPIRAYIEDLGASAAYWVASQAGKVFANETALVGSIGTYGVIYDYSARAAQMGLKVHVLRAGQFKGAGEPGTEVTQEQLAQWQDRITQINEFFLRGVAAGRKLSLDNVRTLADGRVHVGREAHKLGLLDGVCTLEETLSQLLPRPQSRTRTMSQDQSVEKAETSAPLQPVAAGVERIKTLCPGASSDFIVAQLEARASEEQVQRAWQADLTKQLAARDAALAAKDKELAELKAKSDAAPPKKPGVEALGTAATPGKSAAAADGDFMSEVDRLVASGMSRQKAVRKIAHDAPELREAFVAAYNEEHAAKKRA